MDVVIFAAAPTLLGLPAQAAYISYALAGIHLLLTLVTDFRLGVVKLLPFTLHGWVERIVAPLLIILPFVLGFTGMALYFYLAIGIMNLILGLTTDYRETHAA